MTACFLCGRGVLAATQYCYTCGAVQLAHHAATQAVIEELLHQAGLLRRGAPPRVESDGLQCGCQCECGTPEGLCDCAPCSQCRAESLQLASFQRMRTADPSADLHPNIRF